jgi:hypothetical protein
MFNFKGKKQQKSQKKAERKTDSLFYYLPFFVIVGIWIFVMVPIFFGIRLFGK